MALTSYGYNGTVDEAQWGSMADLAGCDSVVGSDADFGVTAVAGADRKISVSAGRSMAHGVLVVSDAPMQLQAGIVSSGKRWDTVVLRRNWQGAGGTTTLVLVPGTDSATIAPGLNSTPGLIDDDPLWLVQFTAGVSQPTGFSDLRNIAFNVFLTQTPEATPRKATSRPSLFLDATGRLLLRNGSTIAMAVTRWTSKVFMEAGARINGLIETDAIVTTGSVGVGGNVSVAGEANAARFGLASGNAQIGADGLIVTGNRVVGSTVSTYPVLSGQSAIHMTGGRLIVDQTARPGALPNSVQIYVRGATLYALGPNDVEYYLAGPGY